MGQQQPFLTLECQGVASQHLGHQLHQAVLAAGQVWRPAAMPAT